MVHSKPSRKLSFVVLARPEGVGRALATYEIPIEGRDEWLAAARRSGMRARTRDRAAAADRATDREVVVVAAVLVAGSEKAAAHRLGLSHSTVKHHLANARSKVGAETTAQLVWILAERLPEPEGTVLPHPAATAGTER
jgi:DNA-binding NarL/FixJ family response regulator